MNQDTDKLLSAVREYLGINWEDERTDNNLKGIINRGMARLQKIAGVPLDFSQEDDPRQLLLDYCRYANSHALEMFEINFESELLGLHFESQIKGESDSENQD